LRVSVKVENQPLLVAEQEGRGGGVHDCEKVMQTKFAEIRVFFSRNITDISHRLKTIFRRNGRDILPCKTKFPQNIRNISLSKKEIIDKRSRGRKFA